MYPKHRDPDYGAFEDQVKTYRRFFGQWPEALQTDLEKTWQVQREKLQGVKRPWQRAKGPVAALQCYLMEHGRKFDRHDEWTKPGHNGEPCRLVLSQAGVGTGQQGLRCPHCNEEANLVHLLWLCPLTQKEFAPLDPAELKEIEQGINLEFWSQGLLQLPEDLHWGCGCP